MKNLKETAKKLRKESFQKNYTYKYFYFDENGNIQPIEKEESRETFENYRKENGYVFDYSGEVSYRQFYEDEKLKGFVLEYRDKNKEIYTQKMKELYDEVFNEFIKELQIKDFDNFEYFLDTHNFSDFSLGVSNLDYYKNKFDFLYELLEKYNNNSDFKLFFDKIIK